MGNTAEVVVHPCADIIYTDVHRETERLGLEEHRLSLTRMNEGWKTVSDSYSTETTSEYPMGTNFDALMISLPERYSRWMQADKHKESQAEAYLDAYSLQGEPGHYVGQID